MSPSRVVVDDDEQQIADLIKAVRRLRARVATTNVRGSHDEFTAAATPATTYQLTYIPVDGTAQLSINGDILIEGTDYSCDYDTGLVTVSASQSSGDKLTFRYLVTDWLVARSLPEDTDVRTDTFNRADSGTTLNPASDGGTWNFYSYSAPIAVPVLGIKSNEAYSVSDTGNQRFAYTDLGGTSCDMSLTVNYTSFSRGQLYFAFDPATGEGYRLDVWSNPPTLSRFTLADSGGAGTSVGTFSAGGVSSGQIVRVTYNESTGEVELFFAGSSKGTVTDGSPLTVGTNVGFGSTQNYYVGGGTSGTVNTGETFDNFSAVPL